MGRIEEWRDQGGALQDVALLYRSNAQSRVLKKRYCMRVFPTNYGGLRFFERQEIKDALAYLRLVSNRDDDAAIERVINTPTRGIGNRTLTSSGDGSRTEEIWQAATQLVDEKQLAGQALLWRLYRTYQYH